MQTLIITMLMILPSIAFAQTTKMAEADMRGRDCKGGSGLCSFTATQVIITKRPLKIKNP